MPSKGRQENAKPKLFQGPNDGDMSGPLKNRLMSPPGAKGWSSEEVKCQRYKINKRKGDLRDFRDLSNLNDH